MTLVFGLHHPNNMKRFSERLGLWPFFMTSKTYCHRSLIHSRWAKIKNWFHPGSWLCKWISNPWNLICLGFTMMNLPKSLHVSSFKTAGKCSYCLLRDHLETTTILSFVGSDRVESRVIICWNMENLAGFGRTFTEKKYKYCLHSDRWIYLESMVLRKTFKLSSRHLHFSHHRNHSQVFCKN